MIAGLAKHFQQCAILDFMNNIYEDEENTDFREFLTPEDLTELNKVNPSDVPRSFKPRYSLRPSLQQVCDVCNHQYSNKLFDIYFYCDY